MFLHIVHTHSFMGFIYFGSHHTCNILPAEYGQRMVGLLTAVDGVFIVRSDNTVYVLCAQLFFFDYPIYKITHTRANVNALALTRQAN